MKTMEMTMRLERVNEEQIASIESKLNINIPESYKKFLLSTFGGQPLKDNFYKELNSEEIYDFDISKFLGISAELSSDLYHTYVIMLGRIPKELITIADDGIGNKICIGNEGDYFGKIYIWWQEEESLESEIPTFENVELLANDFEEFVSYLR